MVILFEDSNDSFGSVQVNTLDDVGDYIDFVYSLLYEGRTDHRLTTNAMAFSSPYVRITLVRNILRNNTCVLL
ncbi:MAG: hypothetical protein P4M11_03280 [Candidatus Pacebacteria bacterium]|nr:hypothetical protein [Candidatus Paceibacterota bacterium]